MQNSFQKTLLLNKKKQIKNQYICIGGIEMNKNFPYKLIAVSTFLTVTTTTVVSPVAAFASESKIEQLVPKIYLFL